MATLSLVRFYYMLFLCKPLLILEAYSLVQGIVHGASALLQTLAGTVTQNPATEHSTHEPRSTVQLYTLSVSVFQTFVSSDVVEGGQHPS